MKTIKLLVISFVSIIIFNFTSINIIEAEEKISLDVVIKEAKENNPEIKMLQNRYLATKQKIVPAKTLEYPQVGFETGRTEQMYFISQMLPFPGELSLKEKIAFEESEIAIQELNSKIREVVAEVKKSYLNYWLVHRIIEIYQENIEIMKRFLNIAKTQYAVGRVTQIDVLKASTELAEMENMLVMLQQEKISIQAELNALLNRPPDTSLGKPVQPERKEIKYT
ncbi:MAG: TolC family protein, partial [Endomicrobiia bacterium]